jgi:hypothetical protein
MGQRRRPWWRIGRGWYWRRARWCAYPSRWQRVGGRGLPMPGCTRRPRTWGGELKVFGRQLWNESRWVPLQQRLLQPGKVRVAPRDRRTVVLDRTPSHTHNGSSMHAHTYTHTYKRRHREGVMSEFVDWGVRPVWIASCPLFLCLCLSPGTLTRRPQTAVALGGLGAALTLEVTS